MKQEIKQEVTGIRIVHSAMIIGIFVFLMLSFFLNQKIGSFAFKEDSLETKLFLIISNIMAISSITIGLFLFRNRLKKIENFELIEKLKKYREATILRSSTIEGPAFFFIVCFMLCGSFIFFIEAILCLGLISYFFPTSSRIANEIRHEISVFY